MGDGWWLASDGKWYPPESGTGTLPPPPPPTTAATATLRNLSSGLTGTLAAFAVAAAVLSVITGAIYLYSYSVVTDEQSTFSQRIDAVTTGDVFSGYTILITIVLFILLIVWTNQAYKAASSRVTIGRRWSSGWAVGGWFIPIANFIIPKMVLNEIDRMSKQPLDEPVGYEWNLLPRTAVADWWWVLYVVGTLTSFWAGGLQNWDLLWLAGVSNIISGVGLGFAAATVRIFGGRLHRHADPDNIFGVRT